MRLTKWHNFTVLEHPDTRGKETRLAQESSAAGDDPMGPGSSFLRIGEHHLSREEVQDLGTCGGGSRRGTWMDSDGERP